MTKDNNDTSAGYPVGSRTDRPHHPDGWVLDRDDGTDSGSMPRRGQPPASGEHDRPKKG